MCHFQLNTPTTTEKPGIKHEIIIIKRIENRHFMAYF